MEKDDKDKIIRNYEHQRNRLLIKLKKIKEHCENQDLYRGRQALASKILEIIKEDDDKNKENQKLKQYLLNIGMIIEELEQQYDDIKDFAEIKEIKSILKEATI